MGTTVGSGYAPSQQTINYDALLTTTLMAYRQKMVDNIFKSNALLAALREYDGIEYQNGGERIAQPLMYEENSTVKSYRGYDTLTVVPQEGMTDAFFDWCEIGGTISISRREERKNSGERAILNLLKKKIMQAEMTIKAKVNLQLVQGTVSSATFVPGNDAKDLFPLGYFMPKNPGSDPAAGGNVGNISRSTYSWWRSIGGDAATAATETLNESFFLNVSTRAMLKQALYRMWNFCKRGADESGPNLVLCDQYTAENYEMGLADNQRYVDAKMADLGFDNVKLKGATMIWDELVPDIYTGTVALTYGSAFFINTQYYKLVIDEETDFITTPFIEPENQTAKTAKVLFMGNSTISNARKLGCLYKIPLSLTT